MKSTLITINRSGKFTVKDSQAHPSQCGMVGVREYSYRCAITGENKLNHMGFLMDNMVVKDYFENTYERGKTKCISCEQMALSAIDFFEKCQPMKKVKVRKIVVEIRGSEHSFINVERTYGAK